MSVYLLSVEAHTETAAAWLRQRWCAPEPKAFTFSFTKATKQSLLHTVLYYPNGPVCLSSIPQLHTEYSLLRQRPCLFLFLHYNLERLLGQSKGSINIW